MGKELGLREEDMCILDIRRKGRQVDLQAASGARLLLWPGLCSIHARFHPAHVAAARSAHPDCRIVTHPECTPEVVAGADATGSTSFIVDYVDRLPDNSTVAVGTEINQVLRLAARHKARGLHIFPLCPSACCNMASVTPAKLEKLLRDIIRGTAQPVRIPAEAVAPARLTLTRMFEACA